MSAMAVAGDDDGARASAAPGGGRDAREELVFWVSLSFDFWMVWLAAVFSRGGFWVLCWTKKKGKDRSEHLENTTFKMCFELSLVKTILDFLKSDVSMEKTRMCKQLHIGT